jgi:cellulose synthase/poly-beta-1,6-N-acetylglucosamine synthase-like glycosyltransferase
VRLQKYKPRLASGNAVDLFANLEGKDSEVSEPLFSIVIACHNHEKFIRDAVESVLRQHHPSTEIVVVDDASRDGSAEVLKSFGQSIVF